VSLPASLKSVTREWKSIALVLLLANAAFLLLAMLTASLPREPLQLRILEALESGDLPLDTDSQYETWMFGNECLILQMLLNRDDGTLRQALGPKVYYRADDRGQCRIVRDLARHGRAAEAPEYFNYTRYWHGHNAAAAALLFLTTVESLRGLLYGAAYGSLLLLAAAGYRARGNLKILTIAMPATGIAFWAHQDFAHSLGNGPADTVLILGFVLLLLRFGRRDTQTGFATYCAAFGAIVAYMEFFTGLLPVAAALLLPFGYFLSASTAAHVAPTQSWRQGVAGLLAFGTGAAVTVIAKLLLVYLVFGTTALASFAANLHVYTQNLDQIGIDAADNHFLSFVYALGGMIWKWGKVLAYGSDIGARVLFASTALAWIGAMALAWRSRSMASPQGFLPCVAGAAIVVAWIAVFPTHSFGHGWFMIRMMIAPIALGWAALVIEAGRRRITLAENGSGCSDTEAASSPPDRA
jgi:hypothetical protein